MAWVCCAYWRSCLSTCTFCYRYTRLSVAFSSFFNLTSNICECFGPSVLVHRWSGTNSVSQCLLGFASGHSNSPLRESSDLFRDGVGFFSPLLRDGILIVSCHSPGHEVSTLMQLTAVQMLLSEYIKRLHAQSQLLENMCGGGLKCPFYYVIIHYLVTFCVPSLFLSLPSLPFLFIPLFVQSILFWYNSAQCDPSSME